LKSRPDCSWEKKKHFMSLLQMGLQDGTVLLFGQCQDGELTEALTPHISMKPAK
jgi:hypothetical protein